MIKLKMREALPVLGCLIGLTYGHAANAGLVLAYEWTPGTNSNQQSLHGVGGPVLADDFRPIVSGNVARIDWWGSAAGSDEWEVTFHDDANGLPAATAPSGGISQHFVFSIGAGPDGNGVFEFSSLWTPQDLFLSAGTDYWFSVANTAPDWTWANPGGVAPTVGTEQFSGVVSTGVGPNGGPHFGPWNLALTDAGSEQDFAFRIFVEAPEPGALALFGIGLLGLGVMRQRQMRLN